VTGQQIRAALHGGKRVYGTCVTNPSLWAIQRYTEIDFAFIDNEHVPLGRESTMVLCQACKTRGIAPVVRIPVAEPILAVTALDAGAEGIVCPYMEDADLLREMVGAVKYRPLKGRKLAEFLRTGGGVDRTTLDYLEHRNRHNVLIINVESVPAVERLDSLLAVDGLDAVLIGPHDLSVSLNMPEQYEAPELIATAEKIITQALAAGLGAGIHYWESLDRELHYIRIGANLIVHSTDVTESARAINGALSHLRAACGDGDRGPSAGAAVV